MRHALSIVFVITFPIAFGQTQQTPHPNHTQNRRRSRCHPRQRNPLHSIPLNQRERAQQLLNRFTFGPRPGDLEQVLDHDPGGMVRAATQTRQHPRSSPRKAPRRLPHPQSPARSGLAPLSRPRHHPGGSGRQAPLSHPTRSSLRCTRCRSIKYNTRSRRQKDQPRTASQPSRLQPKRKRPSKRRPTRLPPPASPETSSPCRKMNAWPRSSNFPYPTASLSPPTLPATRRIFYSLSSIPASARSSMPWQPTSAPPTRSSTSSRRPKSSAPSSPSASCRRS